MGAWRGVASRGGALRERAGAEAATGNELHSVRAEGTKEGEMKGSSRDAGTGWAMGLTGEAGGVMGLTGAGEMDDGPDLGGRLGDGPDRGRRAGR